jgi:hypothetical protein
MVNAIDTFSMTALVVSIIVLVTTIALIRSVTLLLREVRQIIDRQPYT